MFTNGKYATAQDTGSCCTRLVGRTKELSNLALALEESFSGQGWVYSITGGPGIGKTRLATEFAARARDRGAKVVWGRCSTFEVPPNWPWIQVLRGCQSDDYAAEAKDSAIYSKTGPVTAQSERFRLFDRIRSFLDRGCPFAAAGNHYSTICTRRMSIASAPRVRRRELVDANILMLLVFREAKVYFSLPAGRLFRDLALRITKRISLGGLNPQRGRRADRAGQRVQTPESGLVEAIYEKTGGNPLFTEIALRHGLVDWQKRQVKRIPEVLRPAAERYLSAVSPTAKDLLALASLIGGEFEFSVIRMASDDEADQLLDMLAESDSWECCSGWTSPAGVIVSFMSSSGKRFATL